MKILVVEQVENLSFLNLAFKITTGGDDYLHGDLAFCSFGIVIAYRKVHTVPTIQFFILIQCIT